MYYLLGIQYLISGIIAVVNEHNELNAFRVYHTDCLHMICSMLGSKPNVRYYDMINTVEDDKRSCNEIVSERLKRFGIEVVD